MSVPQSITDSRGEVARGRPRFHLGLAASLTALQELEPAQSRACQDAEYCEQVVKGRAAGYHRIVLGAIPSRS